MDRAAEAAAAAARDKTPAPSCRIQSRPAYVPKEQISDVLRVSQTVEEPAKLYRKHSESFRHWDPAGKRNASPCPLGSEAFVNGRICKRGTKPFFKKVVSYSPGLKQLR